MKHEINIHPVDMFVRPSVVRDGWLLGVGLRQCAGGLHCPRVRCAGRLHPISRYFLARTSAPCTTQWQVSQGGGIPASYSLMDAG